MANNRTFEFHPKMGGYPNDVQQITPNLKPRQGHTD